MVDSVLGPTDMHAYLVEATVMSMGRNRVYRISYAWVIGVRDLLAVTAQCTIIVVTFEQT